MDWKKLGKRLLFPPLVICLLLLPLGTALLVVAMVFLEEANPVRIASYVLAFYTLLLWCMRIPKIIRFFQRMKSENKYVKTWLDDARLRMNVTLTGNVLWNGAYAALQLGLGMYHKSAWFYSIFAYYFLLAGMRFFLVRYTLRHRPGEKMQQELKHYRTCGWIFLLMNLALSGMMLFMIRENRRMSHHEITTIAMAAYSFTSISVSIVSVIRYRRYHSPVMSASKAVSLAAAGVSMLTLENVMLTTFGKAEMTEQVQLLFLSISGGVISVFLIVMAVYMLVQSNKKMAS